MSINHGLTLTAPTKDMTGTFRAYSGHYVFCASDFPCNAKYIKRNMNLQIDTYDFEVPAHMVPQGAATYVPSYGSKYEVRRSADNLPIGIFTAD